MAEALRQHPETKAVLMQHSESSTGVLHDVKGMAAVTRPTGAILIVDAVSSLGIADLQMDAWGVDLVVAGSQKGLMLPPGLSFCAVSEKAWGHAKTSRLPKYYFDLTAEWKALSKNEAHFTPAVSIVVGLREVLRMIEAEGLPNVFKRHERLARATRSGAEALGLPLFAKTSPSPALTAVVAPRGLDSEQIVAAYSSTHNITIAGGQGEMKGTGLPSRTHGLRGRLRRAHLAGRARAGAARAGAAGGFRSRRSRGAKGLRGAFLGRLHGAASRPSRAQRIRCH